MNAKYENLKIKHISLFQRTAVDARQKKRHVIQEDAKLKLWYQSVPRFPTHPHTSTFISVLPMHLQLGLQMLHPVLTLRLMHKVS